jgi:hypothetical protein
MESSHQKPVSTVGKSVSGLLGVGPVVLKATALHCNLIRTYHCNLLFSEH